MSMIINPYAFGSVASYYANASQFDGTNDHLSKASAISAATSSQGTFTCWLNPTALPSTACAILQLDDGAGQGLFIAIAPDGSLILQLNANSGANTFGLASASGALTTGVWQFIGGDWDTNFSAGNKLGNLYVGDTSVGSKSDTDSAFSIDYSTRTTNRIGWDTGGSLDRYNGGMAELTFSTTRLDLSNTTNRRKAFSAAGKPVDLGADGSLLYGSQPAVYLNNPFGSFQTNKGAGGNFTVTGALAAAATSPSD